MADRKLYVAMRVSYLPWEMESPTGFTSDLTVGPDGVIGYIPVFEDRAKAEAYYPEGAKIGEITVPDAAPKPRSKRVR